MNDISSLEGTYIFSSTLAETVTAIEYQIQAIPVGNDPQGSLPVSTESRGGTRTIMPQSNHTALWYPIPITAGLERLNTATITPVATLGSSTLATGTAVSSTSSGRGSRCIEIYYWEVVAVVGGMTC